MLAAAWYVIMDLKITTLGPDDCKAYALSPGANTDTKLLIYGLFQKGRVLAQDGYGPVACYRLQGETAIFRTCGVLNMEKDRGLRDRYPQPIVAEGLRSKLRTAILSFASAWGDL